jgi:hypothetical protein
MCGENSNMVATKVSLLNSYNNIMSNELLSSIEAIVLSIEHSY